MPFDNNKYLYGFSEIWFRFIAFFVICFIICFPLPLYFFPNNEWISEYILSPVLAPFCKLLLGRVPDLTLRSDSESLYCFVLLIGILSLIIACISTLIHSQSNEKVRYWFNVILRYYLALVLLKYGADKIFKHQFYIPEPNTLFTPIGQLTPDIVFWSAMGSSYSYTFFSGLIEVIPALMLLFKRTTLAGALISAGIFLNVIMLNFGFDITVKLFSSFLFLSCILILSPHLSLIIRFFFKGDSVTPAPILKQVKSQKRAVIYAALKSIVLFTLVLEGFGIYFLHQNLNDDHSPKYSFHGAWEVTEQTCFSGSTQPIFKYRRFFFHRRSYFITQSWDDEFKDYKMTADTNKHILNIENAEGKRSELVYTHTANIFQLEGVLENQLVKISADRINTNNLPLLNESWHWTEESFAK